MTEFDYISKKIPKALGSDKVAKALDTSRRNKIIEFIKKKTGKKPTLTSSHRKSSINHERFGAVDVAADSNSEMLMKSISDIGGRSIDERKAATKNVKKIKAGNPYRSIVHFDLKTGTPSVVDKMISKRRKQAIPSSFDPKGTIRVEKFKGKEYPLKKDFKQSKEPSKKRALQILRKRYKKQLQKLNKKKKLKTKPNADGYNISVKELAKIKNKMKGRPYSEFLDAVSKFRIME